VTVANNVIGWPSAALPAGEICIVIDGVDLAMACTQTPSQSRRKRHNQPVRRGEVE
jgi:hypothetical protein